MNRQGLCKEMKKVSNTSKLLKHSHNQRNVQGQYMELSFLTYQTGNRPKVHCLALVMKWQGPASSSRSLRIQTAEPLRKNCSTELWKHWPGVLEILLLEIHSRDTVAHTQDSTCKKGVRQTSISMKGLQGGVLKSWKRGWQGLCSLDQSSELIYSWKK